MMKTKYGVACCLNSDEYPLKIFYIKFNTLDEKMALRLVKCIYGTDETAEKALLVIKENEEE